MLDLWSQPWKNIKKTFRFFFCAKSTLEQSSRKPGFLITVLQ